MADLRIECHGTVTRVVPLTDAATDWIDANVVSEGWQWLGNALVVDSRFASDIALGADADGLRVSVH